MLRTDRAHFSRQLRAADGVDLVGVDLRPQPWRSPASRMVRDSSAVNTPVSQNTSQNSASPSRAARGIISWHSRRMYASRRPRYSSGRAWAPINVAASSTGLRFLQPPDHPQLLHLLLRVQAVSAFRLAGGNTHPQHLRQSFRRLLRQLLLCSRPGGPNGGENAAALGQNIQIRHAAELLPQLILPPPAEDQVCMGVHQSPGSPAVPRRR